MNKENLSGAGLTDRENYFPPNTDINTINSTIYTDNGFLASPSDIEQPKTQLTDKEQEQVDVLLEGF